MSYKMKSGIICHMDDDESTHVHICRCLEEAQLPCSDCPLAEKPEHPDEPCQECGSYNDACGCN